MLRPTIEMLAPGEETVKTLHFFLLEIPREFTGVGSAELNNGALIVEERERDGSRQWVLPCAD